MYGSFGERHTSQRESLLDLHSPVFLQGQKGYVYGPFRCDVSNKFCLALRFTVLPPVAWQPPRVPCGLESLVGTTTRSFYLPPLEASHTCRFDLHHLSTRLFVTIDFRTSSLTLSSRLISARKLDPAFIISTIWFNPSVIYTSPTPCPLALFPPRASSRVSASFLHAS